MESQKLIRPFILFRYLFLIFAIILPTSVQADWLPFIINFNKNNYGSGFTNWRISSDGDWTFFANQKALLVYNGIVWNRYELNNHSEVRGVKMSHDGSKLYVGGENEYGYFDIAPTGNMQYHCLSNIVEKKYRNLGNIWDFYEFNGVLYMRGDNNILMKHDNHYNLVVSVDNIYASSMLDGSLYVATDKGLKVLMGYRLRNVNGCEALYGKRINAMVPYSKGLLIGTAYDGLYYYDGFQVSRFFTPADKLLKEGALCCIALHSNKLVVGTIHDGLIVINLKTGEYSRYGEMQGMQSNTVQSISFDNKGNIWCGLDCGIDYILLNYPFTYLYRSPNSYGIGYSTIIDGNYLYLGTDRGLYWTTFPVSFAGGIASLHRVNGVPSSSAWELCRVGESVFCLHDKGVFLIHGTTASRISDILGAWSYVRLKNRRDIVLIGTYNGVYVLRDVNGKWKNLGKIQGVNGSARYMRLHNARNLILYNPNIGQAVEFVLDASLLKVVAKRIVNSKFKLSHEKLNLMAPGVWDFTGNPYSVSVSNVIIPFSSGYLLMDREKVEKQKIHVNIYNMYISYPQDSLVYKSNFAGIKLMPRISHSLNSVRFEYGVIPSWFNGIVRYQYRLNGSVWSAPSTGTTKEYSSLAAGKYRFEVRCIASDGKSSIDSIDFQILPPWYLSVWAYIGYLFLLVAVLWWFYVMEERHVKKRERAAIVEKSKEVDQMKIEIDKLEKDKMDLALKHKSQEIANLVINVARKNEILNDIKSDIKRVIIRMGLDTPTDIKRQLATVSSKISSNIEGDEVLNKFEEQFDLANNNFITKLRSTYPELNHNELMMCAYLKMNLATKEIAPLLNMSVRGVETLRYRLRKKLNLDREDSLTEFLNNL